MDIREYDYEKIRGLHIDSSISVEENFFKACELAEEGHDVEAELLALKEIISDRRARADFQFFAMHQYLS